jgi:hypothetical protein
MKKELYLGLDVHKEAICNALAGQGRAAEMHFASPAEIQPANQGADPGLSLKHPSTVAWNFSLHCDWIRFNA